MKDQTEIYVLPLKNWKKAHVLKFRISEYTYKCQATIVYLRPYFDFIEKKVIKDDILDMLIRKAVENLYGPTTQWTNVISYDKRIEQIKRCYDGGRPSTTINIVLTPLIGPDMISSMVGKNIYEYNIKLKIFLDFIGDKKLIHDQVFTTVEFPFKDSKMIRMLIPTITPL